MTANFLKKYKAYNILFLLIIIGGFLRFYDLNWGAPFYFHPDERNIASSVSQLLYPEQMHPHFFAYGGLPIYAIYFTGVLSNFLSSLITHHITPLYQVPFEMAIIISRIYSAFFSVLLIPILFLLGRKLQDIRTGIIAACLTTMSIGLIQYAHFGTFELWLTFFTVIVFFACLQYVQERSLSMLLFLGILCGILVAVKVSSLMLFPLVILTLIFSEKELFMKGTIKKRLQNITIILIKISLVLTVAGLIYVLTNPFVFRDIPGFLGSMQYESGVALGSLPVFYTGEFHTTIPVLFHLFSVFPFLLNPFLTILGVFSGFILFYQYYKNRDHKILLLLLFLATLFFTQAFLFVKWTRYVVPTLPFFYLVIAKALVQLRNREETKPAQRLFFPFTVGFLCCIITIFTVSFFITDYLMPDTRLQATSWARNHVPEQSQIVSEVYDLGITPFNPYFPHIQLVNFYDLDENHDRSFQEEQMEKIQTSDFIILPSQRILKTRLLNRGIFPNGYAFYSSLVQKGDEFTKVYETPCNIFCKIVYLGDPVFSFEETATVFDRPTLFIFKKI